MSTRAPTSAEVSSDDGFDDDERAALLGAIDAGIAAAKNGEHGDAEEFTTELLAEK